MDNRRIGLFDSGLGGLTVMKELMHMLPAESIVYFGDTGRVPYGGKSVETVIKYTKSDIKFLQTFDLKLIIAACGTASAIALPHLKDQYEIPVMGVTEVTAREAARLTKNGCVGVIGTAGTIRSGAFCELLKQENPEIRCVAVPCPLFVPLVENGYLEHEATRLIAEEYLEPIIKSGADTLILGCTHYPLLSRIIGEIVGDRVRLVNPGVCAATEIKKRLTAQGMLAEKPEEEPYHFYLSDDPGGFTRLGSMFLERPISGHVSRVDIEAYTESAL
ncbi:MAG: glutamate racemase [Ruminococcaceae bacterium]|nr:glutamate racemase [Oscillospiraceae bacterium]